MVMSHSKAIPDRWIQYKPVGERVQGTRFIAFKVPLRSNIIATVDERLRLDSNMLLEAIPDLGLIIDLTNTDRYYDPQYFKSNGVEYAKIKIPGKTIPPEDLIREFKRCVQEYLRYNKHNNKLIGVHCTHGVNRTGFFICNYMISEMTINAEDAIEKFCTARGHPIERQNYVAALKRKESNDCRTSNVERIYRNSDNISGQRRSISNSRERVINFEDRWNTKTRYTHTKQYQHQSGDPYTRSRPPSYHMDNNNSRSYNRFPQHGESKNVDYNARWNLSRPSVNATNWRERRYDEQRTERSQIDNSKYNWRRISKDTSNTGSRFGNRNPHEIRKHI